MVGWWQCIRSENCVNLIGRVGSDARFLQLYLNYPENLTLNIIIIFYFVKYFFSQGQKREVLSREKAACVAAFSLK